MVLRSPPATAVAAPHPADLGPRYKWVVLSNTSLGRFMSILDSAIVIIAMPAIFRGIGLNPLSPENINYLLWMIMGYLLVTAALVVSLGRLGDMFGRVRIYNLGFVVFTAASIALSLDPSRGQAGAMWLIVWRIVQALGGSMLMANSAAILTDAFPPEQRGMALGDQSIMGLSGQFIGLGRRRFVSRVGLAGGVLGECPVRGVRDRVGVPEAPGDLPAPAGTDRLVGQSHLCPGLGLMLICITHGMQPYHHQTMGWGDPTVLGGLVLGAILLGVFALIESRVAFPMFNLRLFRTRAFAAGIGLRSCSRWRGRIAVHAHHLAPGHLATRARLRLL